MHTTRIWVKKPGWCLIVIIAVGMGIGACGSKNADDDYLLRVGSSVITVLEFKHAVAAAGEEAFPGEREIPSEAKNDLRMRVLNQLTEELLISEYARNQGFQVTDAELERAVNDIKADYPDNTFEETLLENAVSFKSWRLKLSRRLLVEKVIGKELVDQVKITSEDVATYYQTHYAQGPPEGESPEQINIKIVRHLRKQKAEAMYQDWIEKLRKTYSTDLNQNQWDRLIEIH